MNFHDDADRELFSEEVAAMIYNAADEAEARAYAASVFKYLQRIVQAQLEHTGEIYGIALERSEAVETPNDAAETIYILQQLYGTEWDSYSRHNDVDAAKNALASIMKAYGDSEVESRWRIIHRCDRVVAEGVTPGDRASG